MGSAPEKGSGMMNLQAIARYPGARSFYDNASDRLLFYGREEEIDLLFHRVCATRLLLLFGKSGVGKTSLLQAGVFERLRQQQNMLPILVRFNLPASPLETIQTAVSETCQKCGVDYTPGEGETLWEFFKTMMLWQGDVLLTPVLVLDQFEEIFTLRSAQERAELACELGDLFRAALPPRVRQRRQLRDAADNSNTALTVSLSEQPPNVNVIISVREDFVGALQELAAEIPGIFDDRVRLNPLSDTQAKQAICQPAACQSTETAQFITPSFSYANDALAEIIRYLRGKSGVIEPFQLQLVCRDIEQQVLQLSTQGQSVACITSELLGGEKRLNAIVKNFYQQTLATLPQRDRWNAQRLCEEGLLNAEGFRLPLQENEIFKQYHLGSQALAPLVEARLLRKESRLESNFYELSHDSLARPILESRPWKLTYKQRLVAYSGLITLCLVAVFGFLQWEEKEQAYTAEKQATLAKQQAQAAREAAEGVLNFLVFDLRDKLEPLGRLDIIEMIQQRVNDYYEKLGIEGQSAKVLNQRAVSYESEGNRLFAQGRLEEAGKAYQRFSSLIKQVALLEPHEQTWQRNISVSLMKIGDLLNAQGKPEEALKNYQESLAIRQKLAAHDPSNMGWQKDLAGTYLNVAWHQLLNQQPEKAIEASQYGLAIKTNERMEATLHTNLAHGYLFTGQFDKAEAIYLRYRDKTVSDGRSFKQAVLDDFKEFRQRGIDHPDMSRIEALMR
ncbi:MAG: ATP-binding protein [Nitrosomonas sp.]|nr:MAG: ATP-binding protein [Nitrosomonas sp.]